MTEGYTYLEVKITLKKELEDRSNCQAGGGVICPGRWKKGPAGLGGWS